MGVRASQLRATGRRQLAPAALVAVALGLPLGLRAILTARTAALADALGDALGAEVAIGAVDLDPTGALRLDRVAVAGLFAADAIEAAVSPGSLLAGRAMADEIRVRRPRLALTIDASGEPTATAPLVRVSQRLGKRAGAAAGGGGRLRRIRVEDGDLELILPGGALRARGVELTPTAHGARVVSGDVSLSLVHRGAALTARFPRSAIDLAIPALAVRRLVAAGGEVAIGDPGRPSLALARVAVTRGVGDDAVRLRGETDGGGTLEVELTRGPAGHHLASAAAELPLAALAGRLPRGVDVAGARWSGRAELAIGDELSLSLRGTLAGAAIDHPLVTDAPMPVTADVALEASAAAIGGTRALAVEQLDVDMGPLHLTGHGRAELGDGALPRRAELTAELRPLPCGALATALPGAPGQALVGFDAAGELDGRLELAYDLSDPEATRLDLAVDVASCRVRSEPPRADVRRLLGGFDHVRHDGAAVRLGEGSDRVVLDRLHRHTALAFVAAEDARFFRHRGFDLEQIERSLAINLGERRLLRGGSTISQQLVKNLFVGPERTLGRKLLEAIVTWRLESVIDKRTILARYLEVIELGDGIYGLHAAARHYFGKSANELGVAESAFLAALTPAPRTLSRRLRAVGGIDEDLARRVAIVLRAMRVAGVIDRPTFDRASLEPLRLAPGPLARLAPGGRGAADAAAPSMNP